MAKFTQFVLIAVLGTSLCFAQTNRGTLTGVITDPSGAVVPGAKVTATHVESAPHGAGPWLVQWRVRPAGWCAG